MLTLENPTTTLSGDIDRGLLVLVFVTGRRTMNRLLILLLLVSPCAAVASGSFMPSGGSQFNEDYLRGKAIISGRGINEPSCRSCHKSYSRSKLKKLPAPISNLVTDCTKHPTQCYLNKLTAKQAKALDAYFKKRYNLR